MAWFYSRIGGDDLFWAGFLSFSTGFVLVCLFWPVQESIGSGLFVKSVLSAGVGLGVSSEVFFLCLFLRNSVTHLALLDVPVFCALLIVLLLSNARRKAMPRRGPSDQPLSQAIVDSPVWWLAPLVFVLAFSASLYSFVTLSLRIPSGGWDAWTIWNSRARFLFRAGDQWRDTFSPLLVWSHPDYPLLLPASVVRLWSYAGRESQAAPEFLALAFTFATVGLIVSSLRALRGRNQCFLAGILLVCTPFFIEQGASQYADVPLGFFYLATIVLFVMQDRTQDGSDGLVVLAGIAAGFAAWTKNEGLLFLFSIASARFAIMTRSRGWEASLRQTIRFAMGAAPIVAMLILFKARVAGPSDIFGQSWASIAGKLLQFDRYTLTSGWILGRTFLFGGWPFFFVPVLGLYFLLFGTRMDSTERPGVLAAILALCITLTGYSLVYVIGPNDLQWWLGTSLDRLLLQLWPSALFLFFLIVRSPEEVWMRVRNKRTAQHLAIDNN